MLRTLVVAAVMVFIATGAGAQEGLDVLIAPGTQAEVLGEGYGFCEGPAADADGNIYFSDGQKDAIHFYAQGKPVEVFVDDSLDANGMMFNKDGELWVCEGAAYQIVAFDVKTKEKRILLGGGERQFNEPNDLYIDETGGFYFSDPNWRHRGQEALKKEDVYYVSADGEVTTVSTVCRKPNGVQLSIDGKTFYVGDTMGRALYKYDVTAPGKLENEVKWLDLDGGPDGMTLDAEGNLYIACGGAGIQIYNPDGEKIGVIGSDHGVRSASNCVFGGPDFKTLYITSADKFLGIEMKAEGLKPLPLR